jgi:hypothetical protein
MLSDSEIVLYDRTGHLTVAGVFSALEIDDAIADAESWGREFIASLDEAGRRWYVDGDGAAGAPLRKLDNPVRFRAVFLAMARKRSLVSRIEQILGAGVSVFFSQIFFKPPELGGPKPIHQDNFYFGPSDPEATITAWVALDDATIENGCLHYGDGSHRAGVLPHRAPESEPFNLQVPPASYAMAPAPVPRGGVSLHHGSTLHQSAPNRSPRPRRAVAMHYFRNGTELRSPALEYDEDWLVRVT